MKQSKSEPISLCNYQRYSNVKDQFLKYGIQVVDNEECDELNNSYQACLTSEDHSIKETSTQLTLLVQETFIKLQSLILKSTF